MNCFIKTEPMAGCRSEEKQPPVRLLTFSHPTMCCYGYATLLKVKKSKCSSMKMADNILFMT